MSANKNFLEDDMSKEENDKKQIVEVKEEKTNHKKGILKRLDKNFIISQVFYWIFIED